MSTNEQHNGKGKGKAKEDNSFIEYIHSKATSSPKNECPDFWTSERACRDLFTKFLAACPHHTKNCMVHVLDVLGHLESIREAIAEQADTALTWNEYYMKNKSEDVELLSDEERDDLKSILEAKSQWRNVYMQFVRKAVRLDLQSLFIADPWSLPDFFIRLLEYIPSLHLRAYGCEASPRRFVMSLSAEETASLEEIGQSTISFAREAGNWIEEHRLPDKKFLDVLYSPEFLQVFYESHHKKSEQLGDLLQFYIEHIARTLRTISTIIPAEETPESAPSCY